MRQWPMLAISHGPSSSISLRSMTSRSPCLEAAEVPCRESSDAPAITRSAPESSVTVPARSRNRRVWSFSTRLAASACARCRNSAEESLDLRGERRLQDRMPEIGLRRAGLSHGHRLAQVLQSEPTAPDQAQDDAAELRVGRRHSAEQLGILPGLLGRPRERCRERGIGAQHGAALRRIGARHVGGEPLVRAQHLVGLLERLPTQGGSVLEVEQEDAGDRHEDHGEGDAATIFEARIRRGNAERQPSVTRLTPTRIA